MDERRQRRICVFTGSRADYGPLSPLIRRLNADDQVDLRLLVSGGHLVAEQGRTVQEIKDDGLTVDDQIEMVLASDSPVAVAKSFGLACIGYADALERISPDLLLMAGDRYEALAAAAAALPRLLPVAHIAGGQLTHGSTDDQTRHAISKLSHLHFTLTAEDRKRLIDMGEHPRYVHHVGNINVDPAVIRNLGERTSLEAVVGIPLREPVLLITYHPMTADPQTSWDTSRNLLDALGRFPESTQIITAPNVDHGSQRIYQALRDYAYTRGDRTALVPSLGQTSYLSLVKHADVVVGNSSSGMIEAPLLQTPTVNIGDRQAGRPHPPSVVDCKTNTSDIVDAIHEALGMAEPASAMPLNHQETEESLEKVVETLKWTDLDALTPKRYFTSTNDIMNAEVVF